MIVTRACGGAVGRSLGERRIGIRLGSCWGRRRKAIGGRIRLSRWITIGWASGGQVGISHGSIVVAGCALRRSGETLSRPLFRSPPALKQL